MRNGFKEEIIKCPFWRGIVKKGNIIICENPADSKVSIYVKCKTQKIFDNYLYDFCTSFCWQSCPVARLNLDEK